MAGDAASRASLEALAKDIEALDHPVASAPGGEAPARGRPGVSPAAESGGGTEGGAQEDGSRIGLGDARERLGVSPHTFRQLLAQYYDVAEPEGGRHGPPGSLSPDALARLGEALRLRLEGWGYQAIRDHLKTWEPPAEGGFQPATRGAPGVPAEEGSGAPRREPPAAGSPVGTRPRESPAPTGGGADDPIDIGTQLAEIRQELVRIRAELARQAELRLEDRDRQLTAALRLQQEIQHLRYELVTLTSRRDRKRRGITPILGRREGP